MCTYPMIMTRRIDAGSIPANDVQPKFDTTVLGHFLIVSHSNSLIRNDTLRIELELKKNSENGDNDRFEFETKMC